MLGYLPFIVGALAVALVIILKSFSKKQEKTETSQATSASSAKNGKTEIESPVRSNIYGPLNIYFGSQTGAAQNFSNVLNKEAIKAGFDANVIDLADFNEETLKGVKLAIFAIATHGEGEPTDNAKKFNDYLLASERKGDEFKGLKYTVFSLGNKQYQYYCGMGRRVNEYLEKLGGEKIFKYGEGDDNESLEDDFNAWKEGIWDELIKVANASLPADIKPVKVSQTKVHAKQTNEAEKLPFVVTVDNSLKQIDLDKYDASTDNKEYDFQIKQYLTSSFANFTIAKELRQKTEDGSTLHLEVDCASAGLTYKTAENIAIFPENAPEVVSKAAQLLNLNLNDIFNLEQNSEVPTKGKFKHPVPSPISIKTYLTRFCDLQSGLRKRQLKDLAEFCENEDNKKKLIFLASNEGKSEYEIQVQSRMLGLLDIIEEFGVKLSLGQLINNANPILPRLYTIASSNKKHPESIHVCASIHLDKLPNGKAKTGLASAFFINQYKEFLSGKAMGKARVNVRESTFCLPVDAKNPIIMVGPGAGIAPFKGFLDEKAHLVTEGHDNPYGDMTLYFGCRGGDWDYIYRDELLKHHNTGNLKDYYVAFSRENQQKVYVQDLLMKNKENIQKLLFEENAIFYMCGSFAMGKDVMVKLTELAAQYFNIEEKEAQAKISELEKSKKIIKELWG